LEEPAASKAPVNSYLATWHHVPEGSDFHFRKLVNVKVYPNGSRKKEYRPIYICVCVTEHFLAGWVRVQSW
jgi:hypothetical protein